IPSLRLPSNHHVPVSRPRKRRKEHKDEMAKKAVKMMMKGRKMSKKVSTVPCGECGGQGHNRIVV
ncbi:hypothetical protein Tco_1307233, partial [Tanacetum coccineum]